MKNVLLLIFLLIVIFFFFKPFISNHLLPIPADTIIGLYHPYRDLYALTNPNGIAYKNFLITDPVRQQFPWRNLAISLEKSLQLPLWNPYTFSGSPLLANFQSATFYPLNIFLFIFPFSFGWSMLVILQPVLSAVFLFYYLRKIKLSSIGAFIGSFTFAFCGYAVAWMQWNTLGHVSLWLPLILLSTEYLLEKISPLWVCIISFALVSQIFGGHLQILFYSILISCSYTLARVYQTTRLTANKELVFFGRKLFPFLCIGIIVSVITAIQWIPTLQFIMLSARSADQMSWKQTGWFLPWQNLAQFLAPDFFGNPTTLNYWGIWNYGEFIGYVGVLPLILGLLAIVSRRDKKTLFFGTFFVLSLLFALPTVISSLPFVLNIPLLATSQPTRLLFITDFTLSILAALGWDYFQKNKKTLLLPLLIVGLSYSALWIFVLSWKAGFLFAHISTHLTINDILTAKRNLVIPTILFFITALLLVAYSFSHKVKSVWFSRGIIAFLVVVLVIDLFRFADKFLPFSPKQYLFPQTATISFLENNLGIYRYMTTDSQILPPNFSTMYHLATVDGYDPLYLLSYGQLIAASERHKPNIQSPFGFNRIITPHNIDSPIMNLLGVRYILSLTELSPQKYVKVFQEGETRVYENPYVMARTFFVREAIQLPKEQEVISTLFDPTINLRNIATITAPSRLMSTHFYSIGSVKIVHYSANSVVLETQNKGEGLLVLTDLFYPTWSVSIDGQIKKILLTDFALRGVIVPAGIHTVIFSDNLFN